MVKIIQKPVPHYAKGRQGYAVEAIVIHVGDGTQSQILGRALTIDDASFGRFGAFMNEEKSSHYSVDTDGEVWQFVKEEDTAWANGRVVNPTADVVRYRSGVNPNLWTISIEHAGTGTKDITDAQYRTTAALVKDISARHKIPLDRIHIIGHREIRADKVCPGKIDIDKIIDMALRPAPVEVELLRQRVTLLERLVETLLNIIGIKNLKLFGMANKKFGAFSSSVDPEKLALTVKGLAVLIPSITAFATIFAPSVDANGLGTDLNDLITTVGSLLTGIGTLVGLGMTAWGLVRKIVTAFK